MPVDNLFFCLTENGKKTVEIIYRNNSNDLIDSKERIFIKDKSLNGATKKKTDFSSVPTMNECAERFI